jgi:hypothetical protein
MKKWITDIVQEQTYDATRQAKFDIATIGQSMGYQVVNLFRYNDLKESNQAVRSRIDGSRRPSRPAICWCISTRR